MSDTSSRHDADLDALLAILEEPQRHADEIVHDGRQDALYFAASEVRALLSEEMQKRGISLSQLGEMIGTHRSMPTRFFNSSGDMKLSTAVLIAYALDLEWDFHLHPRGAWPTYSWSKVYPDSFSNQGSSMVAPSVQPVQASPTPYMPEVKFWTAFDEPSGIARAEEMVA
ncbi:transcriptional regulator with XRE-family HTH domain [Asaia bogorensis NBRC 16594]|nr:transcriptional regulator with XRE-family HTH domain [Asaia bogorensis NBRC 16594]